MQFFTTTKRLKYSRSVTLHVTNHYVHQDAIMTEDAAFITYD